MNPYNPFNDPLALFNSTETMAEQAWRYGVPGEQFCLEWHWYFADGSMMHGGYVETARSIRHALDLANPT